MDKFFSKKFSKPETFEKGSKYKPENSNNIGFGKENTVRL